MFITEECSEEKKEQFRKYLEKHGVIKWFADIFDKLMQSKEKPENPIDFIRKELGDVLIPEETFENLERELEEAHREIAGLLKTIEELNLSEFLEDDEEEVPSVEAGPPGTENL